MPPQALSYTTAPGNVAQCIIICSAQTLAEALSISSSFQSSSHTKRRALSMPTRSHGHHLRPPTNSYTLSEAPCTLDDLLLHNDNHARSGRGPLHQSLRVL